MKHDRILPENAAPYRHLGRGKPRFHTNHTDANILTSRDICVYLETARPH